jgi:LEA14-like dessication related protein
MKYAIPLFLLLFLTGCVDNPLISIRDIKIEGFKEGIINLKILLEVENPNIFSIEAEKASYDLFYKGKLIGSGEWNGPKHLGAKSKTEIFVPVTLKKDDFLNILGFILASQLKGDEEVLSHIFVTGNIEIKSFFITKKIDFNWKYKGKKKEKVNS